MRADPRIATPGGAALIPNEWLKELSADDHSEPVRPHAASGPHNHQSTSPSGSVSSHTGPRLRQNPAVSPMADGIGASQSSAPVAATLEVGPILDSSVCPAALQLHLEQRAGQQPGRGGGGALVGVMEHEHTVNGSVRLSAICMTEVNFRYMKHVLLRFILGKESEVWCDGSLF